MQKALLHLIEGAQAPPKAGKAGKKKGKTSQQEVTIDFSRIMHRVLTQGTKTGKKAVSGELTTGKGKKEKNKEDIAAHLVGTKTKEYKKNVTAPLTKKVVNKAEVLQELNTKDSKVEKIPVRSREHTNTVTAGVVQRNHGKEAINRDEIVLTQKASGKKVKDTYIVTNKESAKNKKITSTAIQQSHSKEIPKNEISTRQDKNIVFTKVKEKHPENKSNKQLKEPVTNKSSKTDDSKYITGRVLHTGHERAENVKHKEMKKDFDSHLKEKIQLEGDSKTSKNSQNKSRAEVHAAEKLTRVREKTSNELLTGEPKTEAHKSEGSVKNTSVQQKQIFLQKEPNNVSEQLIQKMKFMQGKKQSSLEVHLKPESMGKVKIYLQSAEGTLTARIVAENGQTAQLLNSAVHHIKDGLEQQGLKLQYLGVDVGSHEGGNENPEGHTGSRKKGFTAQRVNPGLASNSETEGEIIGSHTLNILA